MQMSILLLKQISELFLMILMGYAIVKTDKLKDRDSTVLARIVLYLVCPCMIINAFQVEYSEEKASSLLLAVGASLLLQVVLLFVTLAIRRLCHLNSVETASVYYSNSGNLIIPLVMYVIGQEWVLYACAFMSIQTVFLWTHCRILLSKGGKLAWKDIVLNINMLATMVGIVLFFTRIRLPEIVNQTMSAVGSMLGPASMIVTGMLIGGMHLRNIFDQKRTYFIAFLRLIFIPAAALVILKISGLAALQGEGIKILLIVFLAVTTPSASTVTQMCQVYGNDAKYASAINVMTTLFALITMPLMVLIYQMVM